MSWESLDWRPADSASLEDGAALLPLWPMLRSAIAESISADAMCPITVGELFVAHVKVGASPVPLEASRSFELLGTDRRGSWGSFEPTKGNKLGGKEYTPARIQELLLEALDTGFEALLGEGLGLGDPLEVSGPDQDLLLLRLQLTSVDNEEVVLVSAYDAVVGGELAAHVNALQALAAEIPATPAPPAPAPQPVSEFKSPSIPRMTPGSTMAPAASPAAAQPVAVPAAPMQAAAAAAMPAGFGGYAPADAAAAAYANAGFGVPGAGYAVPAAANGGYATGLPPAPSNVHPASLPDLTPAPSGAPGYNIDLLLGVNLQVAVEIGRTTLPIRDVLSLTPGSIVELDKLAGEKVDVLVNGRAIAQGEVVVVDENFGVRITDVVARQQRLAAGNGR